MRDGVLDLTVIDGLRDLGSMSPDVHEQIRQLVITFIDDAHVRAQALVRAAADHDPATVRSISHSLAGSSANLGAHLVATICRQIEAQARAGDVTAPADVERLQVALEAASSALRAALVDSRTSGD